MAAQSARVGVRDCGSTASASRTSARLSPTLRAALMKARRRSMVRSYRRRPPPVRRARNSPSAS